jgi:catechol 2,3-dioxygenase-like lactoylglutathione lyase family enzyme
MACSRGGPADEADLGTCPGMKGGPLDHVALWTDQRDAIADFLCERAGMHVIERTDKFTLVGADARKGKLTLFEAEGPREPGALGHVALRAPVEAEPVAAPGGLELRFVHDEGADWDLHHVSLRVPDPEAALAELAGLGFERDNGALRAGDKWLLLEQGDAATARPLLNHLALLVDSVEEHVDEAKRRGIEIEDVVDAPNTVALFVRGPAGIRIEYVEHKPGFALE